MKRSFLPVAGLAAAALTLAGGAAASGGASIANAPLAGSGATLTGNTSTDQTSPGDDGVGVDSGCWHDLEYWRIELQAGDALTIAGGAIDPGDNFEIGLFPAGTTDTTIAKATAVKNGFPKRRAIVADAASTGTYVLVAGPNCYNGVDGPFSFQLTVEHGAAPVKAVVALPPGSAIPLSGALTAAVHDSTGAGITDQGLLLKLYGTWRDPSTAAAKPHLLASASPQGGSVHFTVHLPARLKGTRIALQVLGAGSGFAPVRSVTVQRTVT